MIILHGFTVRTTLDGSREGGRCALGGVRAATGAAARAHGIYARTHERAPARCVGRISRAKKQTLHSIIIFRISEFSSQGVSSFDPGAAP